MSTPIEMNTEELQDILQTATAVQSHIGDAFVAIENKGGTVPASQVSGNLADAILTIPAGAGLNFEVVGGTSAPENPKENTIWINTATPVTNRAISPDDPYMEAVELIGNASITNGQYYIYSPSGTGVGTTSDSNWYTANVALPANTVSVTIPTREATSSSVVHWFVDASNTNNVNFSHAYRDSVNYTYDVPSGATSVWASIRITDAGSIRANVNNAVTGDVWIPTDTYTNFAEINEVKTNGLSFHLLRAKQYIDGEWKAVETKIRKNGEWVSCANYIYNRGKSVVSVCTKAMKTISSSSMVATAPTVGVNAANFWGSVKKGSNTNGTSGVLYLYPKIDLTHAYTLHVKGQFVSDSNASYPYVGVWSTMGTNANEDRDTYNSACSAKNENYTGEVVVDVSNVTGERYIGFCMGAASETCSINVWEIWYD